MAAKTSPEGGADPVSKVTFRGPAFGKHRSAHPQRASLVWAALPTQRSGRPHPDPGSQCPAADTETDTKSPKGSQWYFFIISSFCFIFSFAKSSEKEAVSAWQASAVLGGSPRLWRDLFPHRMTWYVSPPRPPASRAPVASAGKTLRAALVLPRPRKGLGLAGSPRA